MLTIHSVASHDSTDTPFETFSRRVFDSWRATHPDPSQAAMLLVSVEDRRGRIETGPGWGHEHDADLARILQDAIDPSMARGSLDQGIAQATFEMTWVLKDAPVAPWLQDALSAGGVILLGALTLGFLRRRNARRAADPLPDPPPVPRPAAALDPTLRVSQRMQAISHLRERSEKAASSITWLDTGEMPKFDSAANAGSAEPPGKPAEPTDPADADDEGEEA